MKRKVKSERFRLFPAWTIPLIAALIMSVTDAFPQGKFELSGGIGVPELIDLDLKYGQKTQIGACVGLLPFEWFGSTVVDWSCGIEIVQHFAGKAKYTEQAPLYVKGGLMFHDLGVMNNYEEYDISACPRIGWTINFSKKWGMNMELGLFIPLSMAPDDYNDTYEFNLLPSWSARLFTRL